MIPGAGRALIAAGLLAGGAASSAAGAAPVDYRLDPTHSFVTFEVLHFGTSTIRGRFGPLNGEVTLDREAKRGRVQVVVAMSQLSTGLPVLDARLREPDMLATEANPQAYFVAEGFEFDAQGQVSAVRGEFTLRGQGQPLTLTAQRFRCYTSPLFRREVCGGDFEAEFKRSSFGITHSLPFVGDAVRLKLQVEAIAQ
ncbi:YceI family protein [Aquabacterium sp.]|uniref:YceI family protein n=1 Tax=Aquabacterium sp. TaxID=1872578 RepID=UPI002BBDC3D0|nr:YceI family protein [Aquabacterium sp.]HSW07737.1 YceI family protein [Aquabacterium sp.]